MPRHEQTTFPPDAAVFTLPEAAAYLRMGYKQCHQLVRSGELYAKRHGTRYRVPRTACDEWINSEKPSRIPA